MPVQALALPTVTDNPALPDGLNPAQIAYDLNDTGVSAPTDLVPSLQKRVDEAKKQGIDLKIVYYPGSDAHFTMPRNLAELLKEEVSGTILVLNDEHVGSVSPNVPRYALERTEHNIDTIVGAPNLYAAQPIVQVDTFIRDISGQPRDWTPSIIGGVLSIALVCSIVATLIRHRLQRLTNENSC